MADYDAERIFKPSYFTLSHLKTGRSKKRDTYAIGFDSEAEDGKPFLFQFAHPDGRCDLLDITQEDDFDALYTFLTYLHDNCKGAGREYLVFGFNLQYEFTQLFADLDDSIKLAPQFSLGTKNPYEPSELPDGTEFILTAFNDKRFSFTVEFGKSKRIIRVIDAMAFFPTSLDNAAKAIGAGAKEPKPDDFSRSASHTIEFIKYASQDAILTQRLGQYIVNLHETYDVPTCLTAPHFAARTFRRQYLSTTIEPPNPRLEQFGLWSYHGGKNGFYLPKPSVLPNMYHVDIRSAYPEAMHQLPDIERGTWEYSLEYIAGAHAIWEITGQYRPCKYRSLMGKSEWLPRGPIHAWVTGYELDSALAHDEISLDSCEGYVFDGPSGGPLVRYVDDFYKMKRYATNPAEKTAAKLFLNSLYGKFFQKVPIGRVGSVNIETGAVNWTAPEQRFDWIAGGLYHPPFASLITGFVRAKIHGMEHDYESVMTSTDGLFSYKCPPPELIGEELGMLDAEPGTLSIWRERVYIFDPAEPSHKPIYALHGFRGTVEDLRNVPMIPGGIHEYESRIVISLKMSTRRFDGKRYEPGRFVSGIPFRLSLPGGESESATQPPRFEPHGHARAYAGPDTPSPVAAILEGPTYVPDWIR